MAKVALLIGISEYQEGLTPLPKAVNDVEAMRRVLVKPEMGDFAEADVTVLKNPERQEMETAIFQLYTHCQKGDLVLFYFSGHGVTVDNGDFYFSTHITQKDKNGLILLLQSWFSCGVCGREDSPVALFTLVLLPFALVLFSFFVASGDSIFLTKILS